MNDHLCVASEHTGMELDEFLCRMYPLFSKRFLRRQVREGNVLVDGARANPSQRLRRDEVVSLDFDEDEAELFVPPAPEQALEILHEDAEVLVVDKPAALAVEPDRWDETRPSLIGALHVLADTAAGGPGRFRPRLVHRLDKGTSGAVLVAKTIEAERKLQAAFEAGTVRKLYLALVEGEYPLGEDEEGVIELGIAPDRRRSGTMVVSDGGKPARTVVRVARRFRGYTLLECEPRTGRTHQIRVHLAATGFPLVVDPLYGRRKSLALSDFKAGYRPKPGRAEVPLIDRLTLHARLLELDSLSEPGRHLAVEAPLPRDFERVLKQLSKVRAPRARRT